MSCAILAPENGGRRHCCTIDKYLRVGGGGKIQQPEDRGRRGEGGGTADQTKGDTGRHGSGNRKKIGAAKHKEPKPARAGGLWASM